MYSSNILDNNDKHLIFILPPSTIFVQVLTEYVNIHIAFSLEEHGTMRTFKRSGFPAISRSMTGQRIFRLVIFSTASATEPSCKNN